MLGGGGRLINKPNTLNTKQILIRSIASMTSYSKKGFLRRSMGHLMFEYTYDSFSFVQLQGKHCTKKAFFKEKESYLWVRARVCRPIASLFGKVLETKEEDEFASCCCQRHGFCGLKSEVLLFSWHGDGSLYQRPQLPDYSEEAWPESLGHPRIVLGARRQTVKELEELPFFACDPLTKAFL